MKILPYNKIEALFDKFISAKKIVVSAHIHPDGDSMGSCVALVSWLNGIGRQAVAVMPEKNPDSVDFITEGADPIVFYEMEPEIAVQKVQEADLVVFLDMNEAKRAGEELGAAFVASPAEKILIDHHPHPDEAFFSLTFSETEVSSTCELLFHILKLMPGVGTAKNLPLGVATALMCGMTTDTNNFANSVFPTTLTMASELLEAGVDRDTIIEKALNSHRPRRLFLLGHLLDHKLKITDDGVAYMILTCETAEKYNGNKSDTEGFVNIPLTIGVVRMSILLWEEENWFGVSVRSKNGVSSDKCCVKYFHGGGHEKAAGGRVLKPSDAANEAEAAAYIEKVTHEFLTSER
ncbi:MAG: DHH family phosphoesterase [Bacteroidales bacterium]|nr:DHH family phosphoesterase [Bacteroidales bacterium]